MTLDLFSVSVTTAVAITVCGIIFIVETIIRRDQGAGRVWSVSFLLGILTTLAYTAWSAGAGVVAVSIGNTAFVGAAGAFWLGSRRFNQRPILVPGVIVAVLGVITGVAVPLDWSADGSWSGVAVMYACVCGLSVLASVESARAPMGRTRTAWGLVIVLGIVSLFYLGRFVVFLWKGPEDPLFAVYFGSITANLVTTVFTIVGVVVTSVLRARTVDPRAYAWVNQRGVASDGLLLNPPFVQSSRTSPSGRVVAMS